MEAFNKMLSSGQLNNSNTDINDSSYDPILDINFENKAVNDYIKKTNKSTNPFDTSFWDEDNLKSLTPTNKKIINLFDMNEVTEIKQSSSNQHSQEYNAAPESIFQGIKINQGTGMSKGGRSYHKLDFKY